MSQEPAHELEAQLEEFQRRHRLGLITILFTDIVGSTRLKQELGDQQAVFLIQRHRALVREILARFPEGQEIETAGDSFLLVFSKPSDAVKFSLLLQSGLRSLTDQEQHRIAIRIGIHVGEVFLHEHDNATKLAGIQVDTCARVMSLGVGDQIIVTRFVFDNARSVLRGGEIAGIGPLSWMNHGPYRLAGVEEPIEVCEVGEVGLAALTRPPDSEKAHRHIAAGDEPVLGWRPALAQRVPGTEWTLEEKLGEGGFGEVWLARQERLKERRVFKFCFRADRVRALKREVKLFRVLKERVGQHPNIVGIRETYFDEPPFYIVMDHAEGRDLRAWCEAKGGASSVPQPIRLEIAAQVADALSAAHAAGVLHRDVKPTNILVSELGDGTQPRVLVMLTDFGIGQVISQEALAGMTQQDGFTKTMMASRGSSPQSGTQLYMAPELLAGDPASERSDLYSLGIVLYQLLVGDFGRPLTMDWARQIADPLLREDLERCFAGNPEERFASAGELARSLRALDARGVAARRKRVIRRVTTSAVGVVAATALSLLVWRMLPREPRMVPPPKTIAVIPFRDERAVPSDYLSASLTSELVDAIRKVPGLNAVRPPEFLFERPREETRLLLAQVNWPLVFDGSIEEASGGIRIVGRLRGTADDRDYFSQVYERRAGDLLGITNDLALRISEHAGIPSLSQEARDRIARTPTRSSEAYDQALRGHFYIDLAASSQRNTAVSELKRAVELDPNYGVAYADLARAYVRQFFYYHPEAASELVPLASDALRRAFQLDPDLPEAHFSAGYFAWTPSQGWQHGNAIEAYRAALRTNPYWEEAAEQLALVYVHVGLLDEARALLSQALVYNPLNWRAKALRANALLWQGKDADAVEQWRQVPLDKQKMLFVILHTYFATALINLDQFGEASSLIDAGLKADSRDFGGLWFSVRALWFARRGNERAARESIAGVFERRKGFGHFHHSQYNVAMAYAVMNHATEAMENLRAAAADGFPCYPLFAVDRNLDNLRGNPDFAAFLAEQKKFYDDIRARYGEP
jgi:serine/threonine protein kinase/class 3 adenylate cyclase/tetratricopeptide (TPR) repeat protein